MFFANDSTGKRVFANDAVAAPLDSYSCPVCGGAVRLRRGDIKVPHFAHVDREDCDSFTADMSEWHLAWQGRFPEECREVVLRAGGESHRADVLYNGVVIEFQHSPLDGAEFWARNEFYTKAARHLVWVFDMRDYVWQRHIQLEKEDPDQGKAQYKWKWPSRTFDRFHPHRRPNITLLFELMPEDDEAEPDEVYLAHVTWAVPEPSFSRFIVQDEELFQDESGLRAWLDEVLIPKLSVSQTCPVCGSRMVLRHRKRDGEPFFGCSRYPACKGTRKAQEVDLGGQS